jgi:hypothetical protein
MIATAARPSLPELPSGSRLVFGNDFCEALLPGPARLLRMVRGARVRGAPFTWVTPPVTDAGLGKLRRLLPVLADEDGEAEVVVNDWGTLRLLRERAPGLRPVLGRLLARMHRDPRVPTSGPLGAASAPFTALLRANGVDRVELDAAPPGQAPEFGGSGLRATVHLPFGFVSSGRICPFAAVHQEKERMFLPGSRCRAECRTWNATMESPTPRPSGEALLAAGNTVFQRHSPELLAQELAASDGRRFVVRRRPFDEVAHATDDPALARRWLDA